MEKVASEVGLGFNPAMYTFGAFGLATFFIFVTATGTVWSIQQLTGASNVRLASPFAIGQLN